MIWKHLICREALCKLLGRNFIKSPYFRGQFSTFLGRGLALRCKPLDCLSSPILSLGVFILNRHISSASAAKISNSEEIDQDDGTMNEFLSRFAWIMRGKLNEAYPDCDKQTVDAMLLVIVKKVAAEVEKGGIEHMAGAAGFLPSHDFSEDLWKTVWEVSTKVLEDMDKERKKEKMKRFLQDPEVKEMYRFAAEVGIRGDMLREFRFKWAREKMEEREFYEMLESLRDEAWAEGKVDGVEAEATGEESNVGEEESKTVSLPKRQGKFKYKIYGLDLSDSKWEEVANKVHESETFLWPEDPKPISGKCKIVTEKILGLKQEDDPSQLVAEWAELLQPIRIDWTTLLDKLKEKDMQLYYKVAELVLSEESFQTNIHDYTKLIEAYAKQNRFGDAERILQKMKENGFLPDILTSIVLVHMYSKASNLERASAAFESLRNNGFQPDVNLYNSMIMAYVKGGQPKKGEDLVREMEARDLKPTEEIYMALLRSFSQHADYNGAARIMTTLQFAGIQPSLESYTLLVEAYGLAGQPDQARSNFDYIMKIGHKPDDKCTASMIVAYQGKNLLDKALNLLLQLQKDGFEPGAHTYSVLVDWLGKLQLVEEAEQTLNKIAQLGEAPPLKVHVSLCDMYSRAHMEKKALQALGVLESKMDQLGIEDFKRIINGLMVGGFIQDAQRLKRLMEARFGVATDDALNIAMISSQTFGRPGPSMR